VAICGAEGGESDDSTFTPRGTVGGTSVAVTVTEAFVDGFRSEDITCISIGTPGPGSVGATVEFDGVAGFWLTAWNPIGEDGMC
jgi:hypothetical protein